LGRSWGMDSITAVSNWQLAKTLNTGDTEVTGRTFLYVLICPVVWTTVVNADEV